MKCFTELNPQVVVLLTVSLISFCRLKLCTDCLYRVSVISLYGGECQILRNLGLANSTLNCSVFAFRIWRGLYGSSVRCTVN